MLAFRLLMTEAGMGAARDGLDLALSSAQEADRKLCRQYIRRANLMIMRHVLTSPTMAVLIFPPVLVILLGKAGIDVAESLTRKFRQPISDLDKLAYCEGQI
jgi:hypothetical protein